MKKMISVCLSLAIILIGCGGANPAPQNCQQCRESSCELVLQICKDDSECKEFDICYEQTANFYFCEEKLPVGAGLWLEKVDCICDSCFKMCETYCDLNDINN